MTLETWLQVDDDVLTINVESDEKGAEEGILTTVTLPHPAALHQDLVYHVRDATVSCSRRCEQIKQCVMHCMWSVQCAQGAKALRQERNTK